MIRYFLEHKDIPQALRRRLEIEQEVIGVMGADEYPYDYAEALDIMTSHLRDFKEEELQYLKEISAADWIYIDGEVHFQRRFYENLIKTRPDLAARVMVEDVDDARGNALKQKLLNDNVRYMKEHGGRTVHTMYLIHIFGMGIQPPTPSWGSRISFAQSYISYMPTYSIFPGIAIMITVIAFNIFGDGLRDALDPKMKNQ